MSHIAEPLLAVILVGSFLLLGLRRIDACIRAVALQGVAVALLPLFVHGDEAAVHAVVVAMAAVSVIVKGLVVPWLLDRAMRLAEVKREAMPLIGHLPSVLVGVLLLGTALWLATRFPVPVGGDMGLVLPVALATVMIGLFVLVSRRRALNQVLGYLVLENGVFVFGMTLVRELPLLVELGVLMDIFVAVFAMGIATDHIKQTFDHVDTDKLDELKG